MTIRQLTTQDLPQLLNLYAQLHPNDVPIQPENALAIWQQIDAQNGHYCFGLFDDLVNDIANTTDDHPTQTLLATCTLLVVPNLTRDGQSYAIMENVVTDKDHQNQGIGKKLLTWAIDFAWSQNCYKVMLQTSRKDNAITQFYKSVGFSATEKNAFCIKKTM